MFDQRNERWALVAGGSGGVGSAVSRSLASDGWDIIVTYRANEDAANKVVADVQGHGRKAWTLQVDLTSPASARSAIASAVERAPLSGVVYAAGPHIPMKYVVDQAPEDFADTIDADLKGAYNILQPSLRHLRETGGPIVAVVTPAINRYAKKDVLSSAPKAGVQAVVRAIAAEEGRFGVRANCIAVGLLEGEGMWKELIARGDYTPEMLDIAKRNIALRRFGDVGDIGEAAAFLMSNRAGWISAQTLTVDGGYTV